MKLIAIDLDDTLLREDLTVSDKNIESIRKAMENGHHIILASGRGPFSMRKYAEKVGVNSFIVSYNGAMVIDLSENQVIYEQEVPVDVVNDILNYSIKNDLVVQTYEEETIIMSGQNEYSEEDARLTSMATRVPEDFSNYVEQHPPIKFVFPNNHDRLIAVENDLKAHFGGRANVFFSKPIFLEVMHPLNNKYLGVQMVAKELGVAEENICAIGDSMNDFEMIRDSAVGIAMNNARSEIKEIANHVLRCTNEEDGVSEALDYLGVI